MTLAIGLIALPIAAWIGGRGEPATIAQARVPPPAQEGGQRRLELAAVMPIQSRPLLPPLDAFRAVVERPLFTAARRPPTPAPAPVAQPEAAPVEDEPTFRLIGTVRQNGTMFGLLIVDGEDGVLRVSAGDDIEGWEVGAIEGDGLVLSRDGREHQLQILR